MTNKKESQVESKPDIKQLLYEDMRQRQQECSEEFQHVLNDLLSKYNCELDIMSHESMKTGKSFEIRFIPK